MFSFSATSSFFATSGVGHSLSAAICGAEGVIGQASNYADAAWHLRCVAGDVVVSKFRSGGHLKLGEAKANIILTVFNYPIQFVCLALLPARRRSIYMCANPAPGSDPRLTIEHSVSPAGTLTLICRGRITLETSTQFRSEFKDLTSQHKLLLVDLSAVPFVDSAGIGSVFATYISAKKQGCDLMLINVHPYVKDLLNTCNLESLLKHA